MLFEADKFIWQIAAGVGIARYMVSFGGDGWDALPDQHGDLDAVPIYGGYVSYEHYWGNRKKTGKIPSFSSTFVYGYVYLKNPLGEPANSLLTGSYASANVYWNIVGPLNFASEIIYGKRTDEYLSVGDDWRFQFVMEYNF